MMRKLLYIAVIVIDVILIALIVLQKGSYYIIKTNSGFFNSGIIIAGVWILASILFSISPPLSQILSLVKGKGFVIIPLSLFIANECFEFVSFIGGGMSLDDSWIDIAIQMIRLQALLLIPIALSCVIYYIDRQKLNENRSRRDGSL